LKEHNVIATGQGKTLTKLALLAGAMLLAVACGKSGGAGGAGGGSGSVCGTEFSDTEFCAQTGTGGQGTKCGSVEDSGTTCINPEISYGTTEGGIPGDDDPFDPSGYESGLNTWCEQLGFSSYLIGSVDFEQRSCDAPQGRLYGCTTGTDVNIWHWCDFNGDDWKDDALDSHTCSVADRITSITCTP